MSALNCPSYWLFRSPIHRLYRIIKPIPRSDCSYYVPVYQSASYPTYLAKLYSCLRKASFRVYDYLRGRRDYFSEEWEALVAPLRSPSFVFGYQRLRQMVFQWGTLLASTADLSSTIPVFCAIRASTWHACAFHGCCLLGSVEYHTSCRRVGYDHRSSRGRIGKFSCQFAEGPIFHCFYVSWVAMPFLELPHLHTNQSVIYLAVILNYTEQQDHYSCVDFFYFCPTLQ